MATPTNPKLYARIKAKVKAKVKKWPSAYASGQLVRQYKAAGGGYSYYEKTNRQTKKES